MQIEAHSKQANQEGNEWDRVLNKTLHGKFNMYNDRDHTVKTKT